MKTILGILGSVWLIYIIGVLSNHVVYLNMLQVVVWSLFIVLLSYYAGWIGLHIKVKRTYESIVKKFDGLFKTIK